MAYPPNRWKKSIVELLSKGDILHYPEFPISNLSRRRIIRQLPCRFKLRSPWHLWGGIGARFGRRTHLSGLFPAPDLPGC